VGWRGRCANFSVSGLPPQSVSAPFTGSVLQAFDSAEVDETWLAPRVQKIVWHKTTRLILDLFSYREYQPRRISYIIRSRYWYLPGPFFFLRYFQFYHWLTLWGRHFLENPTVVQLVNKFHYCYWTIRRFITVFTTGRHWPLSWTRRIQSTSSHTII
jgi:hypothetical protein